MNNFEKMTAELKNSPNRTFIYGTANYGKLLYSELKCRDISIDGFVTSDEFYSFSELNGIPVYAASGFLNALSAPCNIIIGFSDCPQELEDKLRKNSCIRLYMTDPANIMLTGEWSMSGFYEQHKDKFLEFRSELCDEESKRSFDIFIEQRCNLNYRKPYSNKTTFYDDDLVSFKENEVLADCGAYDGDTVISFIKSLEAHGISCYEKIYAFEADRTNFQKCADNLSGLKNIEMIPKGVYDKSCVLSFNGTGGTGSAVSEEGALKIDAVSLDEAVNGEKITFIKMDIEGSELKALQGAEKTIRKYRPGLAICVYHRADDLITIPAYIKELDPTYRFYLRNYSSQGFDAVLYAL